MLTGVTIKRTRASLKSCEDMHEPLFSSLQGVQSVYLTYVHTFQKFNQSDIQDWVADGLLHPEIPKCSTAEAGNRNALPVHPYKHQSDAIRGISA